MRIISALTLLLISLNVGAQTVDSLNQDVSPKGGLNALAVKYFGIDFTKDQRKLLVNKEIELIFLVDELGAPVLSEVNGIDDMGILDSLYAKTLEIENFNPQIRNGEPEPSIFFIQFIFPRYKMTKSNFGLLQGMAYNEAKLDDFEYLEPSPASFDLLIGGLVNQYFGEASDFLKFGGGMKCDLTVADRKGYIYGINMSFYGNQLKQDYPLQSERIQLSTPPSLLLGIIFGKKYGRVNIQAELNFAQQNVTARMEEDDEDWIRFEGWSPGLLFHYPIRLGKASPMYYYGEPSLFVNNADIHFGLRYIDLSLPQASGLMIEVGLSYRMVVRSVEKYKLKDEFLKR